MTTCVRLRLCGTAGKPGGYGENKCQPAALGETSLLAYPVRFDIYLSGLNFDHHAYMNSIYSFNMFHSLDYLIEKEGGPLRGLPMVQPITGFAMKGYHLWIRCSKSSHQGRPFLQFYNNGSYYDKFMNRRTAWKDQNGRTHWSTMLDEEDRITDSWKKENPEDES